ncbi:Mismatch repair endonuclease pms2 [Phlyctochytrium planicorne]|nr:Mismatch repair endonuclease pms2 [Phlyctochytrium planicorne]
MIRAIDKTSVHRICSGQVILDLATAVKELVENSLDAGATTIDVKFKEMGLEGFEVSDNGSGISPDNYNSVGNDYRNPACSDLPPKALKHYTSKISAFEDLTSVKTFGFRGEALSSLCATGNVSIITATREQAPMGTKLEYASSGQLSSSLSFAREKGTTVIIKSLFESLPVRLREFKKNIKREFRKCIDLLQAYALISDGVRIHVSNQAGKGERIKQIATSGNASVKENFANLFGVKSLQGIMEFQFDVKVEDGDEEDSNIIHVSGLISKPVRDCGKSSMERQYVFLNKRPCDMPKLIKAVNEIYRNYNTHQYPVLVWNMTINPDQFDVNVTPDKRTLLLHNEKAIIEQIKDRLETLFTPLRSVVSSNVMTIKSFSEKDGEEETQGDMETEEPLEKKRKHIPEESSLQAFVNPQKKQQVLPFLPSASKTAESLSPSRKENVDVNGESIFSKKDVSVVARTEGLLERLRANGNAKERVEPAREDMEVDEPDKGGLREERNTEGRPKDMLLKTPQKHIAAREDWQSTPAASTQSQRPFQSKTPESNTTQQLLLTPKSSPAKQKPRKSQPKDNKYLFDIHSVSTLFTSLDSIRAAVHRRKRKPPSKTSGVFEAGFAPDTSEMAVEEFNKYIQKKDFKRMKIIGQFNLGFIVVRLGEDLFIVDQHASKNGFDILIDENEPAGSRIKIVCIPQSSTISFAMADLEDLLHKISQGDGDDVKCTRTLKMLASKACRKSIMIGDALDKMQMRRIVANMAEMDQPWADDAAFGGSDSHSGTDKLIFAAYADIELLLISNKLSDGFKKEVLRGYNVV